MVRGHPDLPFTFDECAARLHDWARYSARPLEAAKLARFVDAVRELERLPDVAELPRLLV